MTPKPGTPDPRREYTERLERRRAEAARHDRRHRAFGNLRLLLAVAAVALAVAAYMSQGLSFWWLLAPVGAFVVLAVRHEAVLRRRADCERAAAYYERALARLDHHWAGKGEAGERYRDPAHPYADDLDLFGRGSLFELLCTARTRMGEDLLASWLSSPAPPAAVAERHAAVAELRPRLGLRENLAVQAEEVRSEVHPDELAAWGESPPELAFGWERVAAAVLAVLAVAAAVVWAVWGFRLYFFAVAGMEALYFLRMRHRVKRVVFHVEVAAHDLAILAHVLALLERERFTSPLAARLRAQLDVEGAPASRRIAGLRRLMELLDSRDHLFMRVVGPFLLYTVQLSFAVEEWRRHSGPAVRRWLAAVGEMEALSALAGYAYEHPADPFPEFSSGGACLEAEGLAHPLLPESRAVRNDVNLGGDLRVLIVSGSNMSGKSTLLRTVGVNAVLAQAGAPVRARNMRLSPLQPGASIRVMDSLETGVSRFYAEITRLRRIVDLTRGEAPVLFLLDEFLHGTNSHDRRIGAEALVRELIERGAVGLVTTHDLALAHIADVLAPRGANVHFEDRLEDSRLLFDYRLRPGVVRKSNALELMRSIGLDV
jgi:hypothetical protein